MKVNNESSEISTILNKLEFLGIFITTAVVVKDKEIFHYDFI